ncbi:hypothetical protein GRI38_12745 [Altererythrobacter aurantiacus]|uniref:Uncharacterized protein n=1 Tax=Parapontixanthobacter aurantiacus TaxID=1463599 RepID=A0A844ZID2_9SPHN|nr:hypothetical protein [Parapontixanthobacter aurantiacus]MXO86896.1 hypothetical protein [Parapontixanthobacter aurantiacus]
MTMTTIFGAALITGAQLSGSPVLPPDGDVVTGPPEQLLLAQYEQCLSFEIEARIETDLSADVVFDESHAACAPFFDAFADIAQSRVLLADFDYRAERAALLTAIRNVSVRIIDARQGGDLTRDRLPLELPSVIT